MYQCEYFCEYVLRTDAALGCKIRKTHTEANVAVRVIRWYRPTDTSSMRYTAAYSEQITCPFSVRWSVTGSTACSNSSMSAALRFDDSTVVAARLRADLIALTAAVKSCVATQALLACMCAVYNLRASLSDRTTHGS